MHDAGKVTAQRSTDTHVGAPLASDASQPLRLVLHAPPRLSDSVRPFGSFWTPTRYCLIVPVREASRRQASSDATAIFAEKEVERVGVGGSESGNEGSERETGKGHAGLTTGRREEREFREEGTSEGSEDALGLIDWEAVHRLQAAWASDSSASVSTGSPVHSSREEPDAPVSPSRSEGVRESRGVEAECDVVRDEAASIITAGGSMSEGELAGWVVVGRHTRLMYEVKGRDEGGRNADSPFVNDKWTSFSQYFQTQLSQSPEQEEARAVRPQGGERVWTDCPCLLLFVTQLRGSPKTMIPPVIS